MDENRKLEEIRALVQHIRNGGMVDPIKDALALAQHFRELDEWLSGQGMFPLDWLPRE